MNSTLLLEHFHRAAEAPEAIGSLRRLILDLAVRGKLVAQDLNSEQLSTHYLGEPQDPELPPNWRLLSFGKHCDIQGGNQPPKSQFIDEPRAGYVRLFQIRDLGERPVPTYIPIDSTNRFCKPGEILIGRYGASVGKIFWAEEGAYNVALAKFIWPSDAFSAKFAFLLLQSKYLQGPLASATRSAQAGFNKGDLAQIQFPLPPLAEQHRIVAKVDELMTLCDQLEKARADRETRRGKLTAATLARLGRCDPETFRDDVLFALKNLRALTIRPEQIMQLRESISSLAVQGRLSEQKASDEPASVLLARIKSAKDALGLPRVESELRNENMPFNLPAGWVWTDIGEISSKTGSGSTPRGGKSAYKKTGVPFLRSQNVYNEGLRLADVAFIDQQTHKRMAGTAVSPRDLLLNITGGSMGRCCHVADEFGEANVSQHVAIIRCALPEVSDFLHTLVLSPYFQAFIFDEQTGAGRGGLPKNRMDRIAVALPPLQEQKRIVAKVDELMTLCDQLEASLASSDEVRSRLLAALLVDVIQPAEGNLSEDDQLGRRPIKLAS